MIAGVSSGAGKTTVATGLMAALRRRGMRVAAAKVGPDFIDPGYHALATGRPGRNLDSWICGEEAVLPLAGRAGAGSEVLVVEGVMGLFDGAAGDGPPSSTASIASILAAPVILVVDASAMSGSVAALVHGFNTYQEGVSVSGVILNRVGSDGHARLLREALSPLGIPVLGAIPRDDRLRWRDRHLGLVPVAENRREVTRSLERLAEAVASSLDLAAVLRLARSAPPVRCPAPAVPCAGEEGAQLPRPLIAVAGGPAFSFMYQDNLEALQAAGADLAHFDPLAEPSLPPGTAGLVAGGGFPEVHAGALASNTALLADVKARVASGLPTWAECGGALWLAGSLDGHRLAGVLGAAGRMTGRLTLGYRRAVAGCDNPLCGAGSELRGHEFHYSVLEPAGDGLTMRGRSGESAGGFLGRSMFASYLHLHLGGDPAPAARFVAAARRWAGRPGSPPADTPAPPADTPAPPADTPAPPADTPAPRAG